MEVLQQQIHALNVHLDGIKMTRLILRLELLIVVTALKLELRNEMMVTPQMAMDAKETAQL